MTPTRRTVGLPTELDVGGGLRLPLTAVTETFAILAKRGAGKTNTAVVGTEEMVGAGQQVVVLDPTGVWWGLRSAASGRGGGLPMVIVGGDHADLPLQQSSGRAVAQLLVAERDHLLEVTEFEVRAAGGVAVEPSTAEQVRQRWRAALKAGARRMLDELLELHPEGMSRSELAERVGIEASGGTFGTYLSTLRVNGLLTEVGGQLHAVDVLFIAPGGQR